MRHCGYAHMDAPRAARADPRSMTLSFHTSEPLAQGVNVFGGTLPSVQRIEALGQLRKYIAFHACLLAPSSRFNMSFNAARSLALKSSIVSLS